MRGSAWETLGCVGDIGVRGRHWGAWETLGCVGDIGVSWCVWKVENSIQRKWDS